MESLHIWGDSILKGIVFDEQRQRYAILSGNCVSALSRLLPIPVVNHARMGQTAPMAEADMRDSDFSPGGVAVLEFGGNDCDMPWAAIAADPDGHHDPKTPLDMFEKALERMAQRVKEAGMRPMLVVPTPLSANRYFDWVTKGLDRDAVLRFLGDVHHIYRWQESYASAVADVASRLSLPLLNLRRAFLEQADLSQLLCVDGIHPSAKGHEVMLAFFARAFGVPDASTVP